MRDAGALPIPHTANFPLGLLCRGEVAVLCPHFIKHVQDGSLVRDEGQWLSDGFHGSPNPSTAHTNISTHTSSF